MSFNANELPRGKSKIPLLESGAYPARVAQIVLLGIQKQRPYNGEDKLPVEEILFTYEFLDEYLKDEDGNDDLTKPRFFSDRMPFYRLDADRAKSTKRYLALDPEQKFKGDFSKLIDIPCMVNLVKNGEYNNVSNISAMRPKEAAKAGPLVNEPLILDAYDPDKEAWDKAPDWIKKVIKEAVNWNETEGRCTRGSVEVEPDLHGDEIPW
jgi:hypothetical protein